RRPALAAAAGVAAALARFRPVGARHGQARAMAGWPGRAFSVKKPHGPEARAAVRSGTAGRSAIHAGYHGVEATVDVRDFAGDAGRQVRQHERSRVAHVFDGDVAAQRGVLFHEFEYEREILDTAG